VLWNKRTGLMKKIKAIRLGLLLVIMMAFFAGCTSHETQNPATIQTTRPTTIQTTIPITTPINNPITLGTSLKVTNITISASDEDLVSGKTFVDASFRVQFPSSGEYTFEEGNRLVIDTDLDDSKWIYFLTLDGIENPFKISKGSSTQLSGWELSYPATRTLTLDVILTGKAPIVKSTREITVFRIRETDFTYKSVGDEVKVMRNIVKE
jgi:hypothetical protein